VFSLLRYKHSHMYQSIELFGRPHNIQPGWITIGNQLEGVNIGDAEVKQRVTDYLKAVK
jgi:mRNA m6A methyltransferase catalytic subunit